MSNQTFQQALEKGQVGESQIAQWMRSRGWHILPAYEKEIDNGKGPRLFTAYGVDQLVSPDLLAMRNGEFRWIEAKHKDHFSWYGKDRTWQTGIDKRHFDDYVKVAKRTGLNVWVLFLHRSDKTWIEDVAKYGAPKKCPTGLYGQRVQELNAGKRYGHQHANGMYYWNIDQLKVMATLADVTRIAALVGRGADEFAGVEHRRGS